MIIITELKPKISEFIPDNIENGILYISEIYSTAMHLCVCGCGNKVVTPLGDKDDIKRHEWSYVRTSDNLVTLRPSIGNHNFPCKSHYWITNNKITQA